MERQVCFLAGPTEWCRVGVTCRYGSCDCRRADWEREERKLLKGAGGGHRPGPVTLVEMIDGSRTA